MLERSPRQGAGPEFREQYGRRITFRQFDGEHLPFINDSVNHLLSLEPIRVSPQEIHRALVPGGMAVFPSNKAPEIGEELAAVTRIESGRYEGFYRFEKTVAVGHR